MEEIKVFLDTDVIISSLLSRKGASYQLIAKQKVNKVITQTIAEEIKEVTLRKNIDRTEAKKTLKSIKTIKINLSRAKVTEIFSRYVSDIEDSHVVAGASKSKTKFLLTYNLKHYKKIPIKNELGIIVLKPGEFLQYLRSR